MHTLASCAQYKQLERAGLMCVCKYGYCGFSDMSLHKRDANDAHTGTYIDMYLIMCKYLEARTAVCN